MICDRLVVGIRDRTLSEKLQLDAGLTLESAKKNIRQQEAVRDQRKDLQPKVNLQALGGRKPPRRGGAHGQQPQSGKGKPQCTRCGKGPHSAGDLCPAKSAVCHKCNKKGHYSRFCFTKTTRNPPRTAGELSLDAAFLYRDIRHWEAGCLDSRRNRQRQARSIQGRHRGRSNCHIGRDIL